MAGEDKPIPESLRKRREPVQDRSLRSRAHILEVAAALLEEVGLDSFNTNLLAERADVRVRTVYRYFPNKLAVIAAIGEKLFSQWAEWYEIHFEAIATPGSDWESHVLPMIEEWASRLSQEAGGWAVIQAMNAVPVLRELDRAAYEDLAGQWESAIRRRLPDHEGDLRVLSLSLVSIIYGYIDTCDRIPANLRSDVASEIAALVIARLRPLLGGKEG